MPEDAAGEHQQARAVRSELAVDLPEMPAHSQDRRERRQLHVHGRVVGQPADVLGTFAGFLGQVLGGQTFGVRFGDHTRRGPAHAQVALDRAAVRRQRDRSFQTFTVRRGHRRVDVRGRAADVHHQHGALMVLRRQPRDARQHRVGRHGTYELPETGAARETLAADHVLQEGRADRPAGRFGSEPADVREHVRAGHDSPLGQEFEGFRLRLDVARQHDRHGDTGELRGVVQQDGLVAAVRAADQQDQVGRGRPQCFHVDRAGADVHDLGSGGQRDPVAGLRAHDAFLADDREPEATTRRRAGQDLAVTHGLPECVDAAQHLGRCGRVLSGPDQLALLGEERGLGPGGTDVEAEDHGASLPP